MRKIEFRGKSVKNNRWYYGDLQTNSINDTWISELDCGEGDRGFFENVKYQTVGQFTGCFDIKGNKIFEGDIVKYTSKDLDPTPAIIVYSGTSFSTKCSILGDLGDIYGFDLEIIGNIYDNPELVARS